MKAPFPGGAMATIPALALAWGSCTSPGTPPAPDRDGSPPPRAIESVLAESPEWVDWYEPARSSGGYTLALLLRRIPFLMDMHGRVVHVWPGVRASGRARLMPSGHLGVLTSAGRYEEYDWDGRPTWTYSGPRRDILHHDFARLSNGNSLFVLARAGKGADYLLEVDRGGHEVWRWNSWDALPEVTVSGPHRDQTHVNSVQELPPNPLYDRGHEAFRPGNILLSARNLNTLFVIARPGGEVVWRYDEELDWQHEARMTPSGVPGAGGIVVFDNRYHDPGRHSEIVAVDPTQRSVTWSYRSEGFFSSTGGAQQVLPNGNLLVTSSRGGRVFELTREGDIVWQWAPPYRPMRALRYPVDFCPQLASLEPPPSGPVRRRDPGGFVDADLYAFARTHEVRHVQVRADEVPLLTRRNDCQRLRLPAAPQLRVEYGIQLGLECGPDPRRRVRFGVSVRPETARASEDVWVQVAGVGDFEPPDPDHPLSLRRDTISLQRFEGQDVEMCVTLASFAGGPVPECFVWGPPRIRPADAAPEPEVDLDTRPEVEEHLRQQLEALGYVN